MTPAGPDDVRDLLPPVRYGPAGPGTGGPPAGAYPAAAAGGLAGGPGFAGPAANGGPGLAGTAGIAGLPGPAGPMPQPAGAAPGGLWPGGRQRAGSARTVGPVSAWSPLVLATIAMAVAISVMAPIIGTLIALAVLVALRAASITGRHLAKRGPGDGRRVGRGLLAVVMFPLAALRAVLGLLLTAPLALLAFCVVAAITIIAVPLHPLPQALALGAGALVAVVGIGPGSAGSRKSLAGLYSAAARRASLLAVAYVGVGAVAVWAGLTAWHQSPAPAYWPVSSLHNQLLHFPAVRSMLTDVRQNLLRLARQIGL